MCRSISNMLFALFAVALILPAPLEAISGIPDCRRDLYPSGNIYCQLSGHNRFYVWHEETCELECVDGTKAKRVRLPESVCPLGKSMDPCNPEPKDALQKFNDTMHKIKKSLVEKWCNRP
uniref:Putative conserved secreted protein n=1 Tax=Ixodes ricinus TaxID=34613 RepID=A0A6B0UN81_IXORI